MSKIDATMDKLFESSDRLADERIRRDGLIRELRDQGVALRTIAVAARLSPEAVRQIASR